MYFETPAPSILQVPGAKDVAIEFHSLSKTFNMTGWRVGFAVGGAPMIAGPRPGQGQHRLAASSPPSSSPPRPPSTSTTPSPRRSAPSTAAVATPSSRGLKAIGWDVPTPQATFYVWIPCPEGFSSTDLCGRLLDEADVVTTPGLGFGKTADGYIRAALTVETPRLLEAVDRIGKLKF